MSVKRLLLWLFSITPLLITLFVLPVLPDSIPAHYGIDGNVTRYGSKYLMLFLPIFIICMGFFWLAMEKIAIKDKTKGAKNAQSVKVLYWANITTTLVFTAVQIWFLRLSYTSAESIYSSEFDLARVVAVCMCISFIVIGNLLPKCKRNYFIGIRTKWTLDSELSWYKTHRLGGRVMVIFGIIAAPLCLFVFDGAAILWISIGGFAVLMIPLIIYSRHVYMQEKAGYAK